MTLLAAWRVGLKLQKEAVWLILYFFLSIVWLGILGSTSRGGTRDPAAPWANNGFLADRTTWAGIPSQVPAGGYPAGPGRRRLGPAGAYPPARRLRPPPPPPAGYEPPAARRPATPPPLPGRRSAGRRARRRPSRRHGSARRSAGAADGTAAGAPEEPKA